MDAYVNKVVQIITNDGRVIVGVLKGFDQTTNVILEECHERVFSTDAGVGREDALVALLEDDVGGLVEALEDADDDAAVVRDDLDHLVDVGVHLCGGVGGGGGFGGKS